jgi:hypothetical protein
MSLCKFNGNGNSENWLGFRTGRLTLSFSSLYSLSSLNSRKAYFRLQLFSGCVVHCDGQPKAT